MSTTVLRITIGAPLVALALVAFLIALMFEWVGDRARACPDPENPS